MHVCLYTIFSKKNKIIINVNFMDIIILDQKMCMCIFKRVAAAKKKIQQLFITCYAMSKWKSKKLNLLLVNIHVQTIKYE